MRKVRIKRLMFWNIAGIWRQDIEFWNFVGEMEDVCLIETLVEKKGVGKN